MIDIEKKIAERTLKKLHIKSWNKLTIDDVLEKNTKKQNIFNTKNDLLKKIVGYGCLHYQLYGN